MRNEHREEIDNIAGGGSDADDVGIEELLRTVGVRDEPAPEVTAEVREAVHAQWRALVTARRRQRFVGLGLAASVAGALAVAVFLLTESTAPVQGDTIATVIRIEGRVQLDGDKERAQRPAVVGDTMVGGTVLVTDGQSRVALALAQGLTVRVDAATTIRFTAADRLSLLSGAVYVDAATDLAQPTPLSIDTSAGVVRHVGTQYQVRSANDAVEIGVREGRVQITNAHGVNTGNAGERLRISMSGNVAREPLSPQDVSWRWIAGVAPVFDIADRSLDEFLKWAARETGRRVRYASAEVERAAHAVKLRGSIVGLDPETAITAVLSTTGLRRVTFSDDFIEIDALAAIESRAGQRSAR